MRSLTLSTLTLMAATLVSCRTVESGREVRPWWEPTLDPAAVPWYLPVGPSHWAAPEGAQTLLGPVDYQNAHGAGWWDVPFVLTEQVALVPSYITWGLGDTIYEDLLGGSPTHEHDQWQWKAVNWTLGPFHAVLSTVNLGVVLVFDTVVHDPIAAIWWKKSQAPAPAPGTSEAPAPSAP